MNTLKSLAFGNRKGFTLIELLVVIAIIGILAALIITSLTGAQLRARDTQTKNNVRSLSTALEQYYTDQTTAAYPASTTQVAFSNAVLTTPLAPYVSGGANSALFTAYSGVTTGYITAAGGTSYLASAGLRNTTEATIATGNGEYLTNGGGTPGNIVANSLTLTGINSGSNSATGHAWVVYGPQ